MALRDITGVTPSLSGEDVTLWVFIVALRDITGVTPSLPEVVLCGLGVIAAVVDLLSFDVTPWVGLVVSLALADVIL